jgi:hypothetical protein
MSQNDTDQKRKKIRTALYLLLTVVVIYLVVIIKEW